MVRLGVAPPRCAEDRAVEEQLAGEGVGVRIGEQLARVRSLAGPDVVPPVDSIAVALPGADVRNVTVPDLVRRLG